MKRNVMILSMFLVACAGPSVGMDGKGKNTNSTAKSRSLLPGQNFEAKSFLNEKALLLSRKTSLDNYAKFGAVPQKKKLDFEISGPSEIYQISVANLQSRKYGEALSGFSRVISRYPNSEMARLALYQKASVYRLMNLKDQSVFVLRTLVKKYPGTLEAKRALVALKTIQ